MIIVIVNYSSYFLFLVIIIAIITIIIILILNMLNSSLSTHSPWISQSCRHFEGHLIEGKVFTSRPSHPTSNGGTLGRDVFFLPKKWNKHGWWYTYPSEKYEFVSWDKLFPIYIYIYIIYIWKNMFQTTNQMNKHSKKKAPSQPPTVCWSLNWNATWIPWWGKRLQMLMLKCGTKSFLKIGDATNVSHFYGKKYGNCLELWSSTIGTLGCPLFQTDPHYPIITVSLAGHAMAVIR